MFPYSDYNQLQQAERTAVTGSPADPLHAICQLKDCGIMVREAHFHAPNPGRSLHVLQMTDMHLNALSARDLAEHNPVIESTRQYRMWCRDRASVPNAVRCMQLSPLFDQTIVTGDTLDYLTWGSIDLLQEVIWDSYPETLVCLGGHDVTRKMQGLLDDPSSLDSRYALLQACWKHDLFYVSKVLDNRVMLVLLDNGSPERYGHETFRRLSEDIERARRENLILLLFEHEPLGTNNPDNTYNEPIRINDGSGTRDFYHNYIGSDSLPDPTGTWDLILHSADVIKGIFCGHRHCDHFMYVRAYAPVTDKNTGETTQKETLIPQYVLTGTPYDQGHVLMITID